MATRNIVPRATGEGSIGTPAKHWGDGQFDVLHLGGGDVGSYLAESTGYGIVSGCEPTISGLTVTVGAGIVHLADGTRKEISATNITLDNADPSNPRIDLVYITSAGEVAKVTGTTMTETAYKRTYTVTTNFAIGDTVTIGDATVTATASSQNGLEFTVGDSIANSARNLINALNNNNDFIAKFIAASNGATITVFEKKANHTNQPGNITVSGTGAITTNAVGSDSQPVLIAPDLPTNAIGVAKIIIAVNANKGKILDNRDWIEKGKVEFLFPQTVTYSQHGDCEIVKTKHKVFMIDAGAVTYTHEFPSYLIDYMTKHGIDKVDVFLLSHYHGDHYLNLRQLLTQNTVDFSNTVWLLPPDIPNTSDDGGVAYDTVVGWIGSDDRVIVTDNAFDFNLEPNVKVELFNCSTFDRLYYQAMGLNLLNTYSTYTKVLHDNIKAFYTGDGLGAETRNYILGQTEKVSLYKIAHHGHGDASGLGYDGRFLFNLNPDVALFNSCAGQFIYADNNWESTYLAKQGANVGWLALASAEFKSDGNSLLDVSSSMLWKITQAGMISKDIYVDANGTSSCPDGTKQNPYPTIMQALARVKSTEEVTIHLANGTYSLQQQNKLSIIYAFDEITLSSAYIGNGRANFNGNILNINGAFTTSNALVNSTGTNWVFNISASGTINITNSKLYVDTVTEVNAVSDTTSSYTGIIINNSEFRIGNLTSTMIYNCFAIRNGSTVYINTVTGTKIGNLFADVEGNIATGWAQVGYVNPANTYAFNINTGLCKNMVDRGQLIYYNQPAWT